MSAASAGVAGMDSLGNCTQSSAGGTVASSVASAAAAAGAAAAGLPDLPRYPWMALTGGNNCVSAFWLFLYHPLRYGFGVLVYRYGGRAVYG